MKKVCFALSAFVLLFACTPENNGSNQNNSEEPTITGEALEVTDLYAILTGYANLPLELGNAEVGIMYDKVQSFESAKKAVATEFDGNNMFTVTVTGLEPSTTYYYKSYVQNGMAIQYGSVKSFATKELTIPLGAVDLGIVMTRDDGTTYNLYWATSNLSEDGLCSNPEDYGDYYAWGETAPHYSSRNPMTWKSGKTGGYTWASYSLCDASPAALNKYNYNTSYGFVDNMTEFKDYGYVHDAARANEKLGGKWRIPTEAEWTELRTKCTWTWTTRNGVNGRLVTAENGNSIFLPAAGKWQWTDLSNEGTSGGYWSSSLSMAGPVDARYVYIDAGDVGGYGYNRCFGFSIRPVSE